MGDLYRFYADPAVLDCAEQPTHSHHQGTGWCLLYIGISSNAYNRFKQHRADKDWLPNEVLMFVQSLDCDRQQLERIEVDAIKSEGPIFNKMHNGRADGGAADATSGGGELLPLLSRLGPGGNNGGVGPCWECGRPVVLMRDEQLYVHLDDGTSVGECTKGYACAVCAKRIGKMAGHRVFRNQLVLCMPCVSSREVHRKFFPDCPELWHDLIDHRGETQSCTRAGVRYVLRAGWINAVGA